MSSLSENKKKLYKFCLNAVSDQIDSAQAELKNLQEMEGEETKSSAGDKYETSRAMLFLEKEKASIRLSEALKKQKALRQINIEKIHKTAAFGSLVKTEASYFFLAVSLGKETIDGVEFFVISPVSPIGKVLMGKKEGDTCTFNGASYQVLELI